MSATPPQGPQRPPDAPVDFQTLVSRSRAVTGRSVADLARGHGYRVPGNLSQHKGFVGQLIEVALGADAGSESRPDFTHLGIELKTLPIRDDGTPLESTFVCKAIIDGTESFDFKSTALWHKLAHVLFFPVQGDRAIPLTQRRFGMPFLWEPSGDDVRVLEGDWRELSDRIRRGQLESITARDGAVLQLRPKGVDSHERASGLGAEGWLVPMPPRGWYLRRSFTASLVRRAFEL
jgi:DNA mismatch repair protein MutH